MRIRVVTSKMCLLVAMLPMEHQVFSAPDYRVSSAKDSSSGGRVNLRSDTRVRSERRGGGIRLEQEVKEGIRLGGTWRFGLRESGQSGTNEVSYRSVWEISPWLSFQKGRVPGANPETAPPGGILLRYRP